MAKYDFLNKIIQLPNKRINALFISLLCGIIGAIPYYCDKLFVLTFVSLFTQFYTVMLQRRANKGVFLPFFLFFLGFYFSLYLFLSELYPFERFGFTETQAVFVVVCSCLLIPILHASVEAMIMWFSKYIPDNTAFPIGCAALWVLGEALLTVGSLAFPWANISVSLTGWLPYLQTASLFGNRFVTFVTVLICCILAFSLAVRKKTHAYIGLAVASIYIISSYALWFIPTEKVEPFNASIIQGNVLSNEKWSSNNRDAIFDRYISMTEDAAKNGADLIFLPESAIPSRFVENGRIHKAMSEIAEYHNVTIFLGINHYDEGDQFNSVIAVMPDGSISERYDKRHLVPFGEFIPFADSLGKLFPFVGELSSDSGAYSEGDRCVVINTELSNVAPLVCFDSIFPEFSREASQNGATTLAVVTNDSWFNDSAGIYTHLRHSQLRAIENRRYILRAANTGISAFINQRGEIIESTKPLSPEIVYADVYNIKDKTLYTATGDLTVYFSLLLVSILVLYTIRSKTNGKNKITSN